MEERQGLLKRWAKQVLRTMGIYSLALRTLWHIRHAGQRFMMRLRLLGTNLDLYRAVRKTKQRGNEQPHGYDVICLPVILWHSRFQRPQQLMAQLAQRNHRVFYASVGFHGGTKADVTPIEPGLFEMTLPGTPGASVYTQLPSQEDVERMAAAIDRLRIERRITTAVVVVQLPFWTELAKTLRDRFQWPIVYDCMDDHSGFSTNSEAMLQAEDRTVAEADLVVVTADLLHEKVRSKARRTALIRNACDYDHFAAVPTTPRRNAQATIGFYGAIAEWFDADLVADLAELRPNWKFQLIGSTATGDVARLKKLPNVAFLGEQPYAKLPTLVASWDCFIVPFKRIPLTEATNPVKAYEMLATGKPLVAVNLPELRPMADEGLLTLADDANGFAQSIDRALAADNEHEQAGRRAFAARNTWHDRCEALDQAMRELFPPASIIVVTYNNLHLNRLCLHSIFCETDYPNFEVIVVDNASTDGTPEWLANEGAHEPRLTVIANAENRGFSGANNQGLQASHGEFLCLLNNDTVVTHGWLSTLIGHLQKSPDLGLVGPVTNMVGNDAKIPIGYTLLRNMPRWAQNYCRQHDGETVSSIMLGFFCVAMRRDVYRKVGELDEQFGIGFFEDTDYCYRTRQQGYELRFAHDAFVHHWQGASFRLLGDNRFVSIYEGNQQLFETKWGADSMAGAY